MTTGQQLNGIGAADERAALRSVPILADIDDEQLDQLAAAVERRHVPANEWLFEMGEPSDAIYVVDSGRFAVVGPDGQVFRELSSGDSIGELGLIAGAPRSAGVRALRDGSVWRIDAETFTAVLDNTPALQSVMLRSMARMLRDSRSTQSSGRPRVVGVVSTGDVAANPVVESITKRLSAYGAYAVVAPTADEVAEVGDYAHLVARFNETLDRAERTNDWVLVVADRGSGELWRRYVATQSDRLVVLVDQPSPPEAFDELATQGPVHLVNFVDQPDTGWWDVFEPVSHHTADDDGLGALARRIAGKSFGLVLAGGGVRGLSHFGVYEELTRAGIVIDRFGGTSAGALASATFALGMAADEAIGAVTEFVTQTNPIGDYAVPAVALTRGGHFDRVVQRYCGDMVIEHLKKGFFAVSSDMISGSQVVHRRGSLAIAVRASISIPGLMPPVRNGDQLLIDGGILNNLPADVMCADPDGEVICVDLVSTYLPSKGFGVLPSFVQPPGFLRRLLTGSELSLPPLQETLFRTVDLAASTKNLRELPRIAAIIEPDVSKIGMLNFKQTNDAIELGRIATRAALEANPHLVG